MYHLQINEFVFVEMQHEQANGNVPMMPMADTVVSIRTSLADHPQIRHTRRTLLKILRFFLVCISLFPVDFDKNLDLILDIFYNQIMFVNLWIYHRQGESSCMV